MDATWAQGLVLVNVSLHLPGIASRPDFTFTAETAINLPRGADVGAETRARVDFLGGLFSVGAGADPPGAGSNTSEQTAAASSNPAGAGPNASAQTVGLGNGSLSFSVHSSGGVGDAGPAGGVSITFGSAGGQGNRLIGVSARNVALETRVQMVVGSNSGSQAVLPSALRSTLQRQIRGALGTLP